MRRRMSVAALVAGLSLGTLTPAAAKTAGEVTVGDWRALDENTQRGMVVGHIALSDVSGIVCQRPGTVAEYMAALTHRPLTPTVKFAEAMLQLQTEHACGPAPIKPDA